MYVGGLTYLVSEDNKRSNLFLSLAEYNVGKNPPLKQEIIEHFSRFVRRKSNNPNVQSVRPFAHESSLYLYVLRPANPDGFLSEPLIAGSIFAHHDKKVKVFQMTLYMDLAPPLPLQYLGELNRIVKLEANLSLGVTPEHLEALLTMNG